MARVGDRVKVNIRGAVLSGTVHVSRDSSMSVSGKIIQDLGHSWLIRLDMAVDDKDQIVMPKGNEVTTP